MGYILCICVPRVFPFRCPRPPPAVQTVLTAVATMLGHQEPTWGEVRRVSAALASILVALNGPTGEVDRSLPWSTRFFEEVYLAIVAAFAR